MFYSIFLLLPPSFADRMGWYSTEIGRRPRRVQAARLSGNKDRQGKDTMWIAVCDDEKKMRDYFSKKIRLLYPEAKLRAYGSGEELLLSGDQPDILLLDIQMPGKNGMETAEAFRRKNRDAVLIFVTAFQDYVFQAFDVGAFHYLVKPFGEEKLTEVLKHAAAKYEETRQSERSRERQSKSGSLLITAGGAHIAVHPSEIIYAEVFNRKIIIHTTDREIEYYGKMKELAAQVGDGFYRPHRAYLVNFAYVKRYNAGTIWLEKGQALMAKQNYQGFVKSYLRYNQREGRK